MGAGQLEKHLAGRDKFGFTCSQNCQRIMRETVLRCYLLHKQWTPVATVPKEKNAKAD